MLILYFLNKQFVIPLTCFSLSWISSDSWWTSIKPIQKINGLSNTLKFEHEMFVAVTKFVWSSAELVHNMLRLQSQRFLNGSGIIYYKFQNHCKNLLIPEPLQKSVKINLHILWTSPALLKMNFIISANILGTNFNVFNSPSMFLYRLYWCSVTPWRRTR